MPEPQKPAQEPAAKAPIVQPGTQPGVTPPGAQPGQPGSQPAPATDDQKTVPLAALHEERDKTKALKEELDVLKQMLPGTQPVGFGQQPQQMAPYPVQQPTQNVEQQMAELWERDPRKAMQTEIQLAFDYQNRAGASIALQEDQINQKHTDYTNYRPQIQRYLQTLSPDQKMRPGVVEMAYYLVKGQQVDTLTAQATADMIAKLKAGEAVQGVTGTVSAPAVPAADTKATPEQINAATAMGIPVEEYMKHRR